MRHRFAREVQLLRAAALCGALALGAWAQGQHLVQAVLDGLTDPLVARQASLLLQEQEGVLMARLDVPTRNLMLHVAERNALDLPALNALLGPFGITARCFERGPARDKPFRHLDPQRCGAQPAMDR